MQNFFNWKWLLHKFALSVKAESAEVVTEDEEIIEETTPVEKVAAPNPTLTLGELRSKLRSEERAKLHTQMQRQETQNATLKDQLATANAEVEKLTAEISTLKENSTKSESELVKDLTEQVKKLGVELAIKDRDLQTLSNQAGPNREELEEEIRKDYELQIKRMELISTYRTDLIPELVMGSTIEELEAAVALSEKRYAEIRGSVVAGEKNNSLAQPAKKAAPAKPQGTSPKSGSGQKKINQMHPEEIRELTANMTDEQFEEWKQSMGIPSFGKASQI